MDPDDADRSLDSPLRLVLVADLLERRNLSLRDAVLRSGRHEQDVVACLQPLVAGGVLRRTRDEFAVARGLGAAVRRALEDGVERRRERLERERFVRSRVLRGMIGVDPKMQIVFEAIRQGSRLDVAVLITGETGSGKELVARAVHELGPRRDAVFEAVNCATLPTALFESHMFGHARGAFTGAVQEHAGVFERCHGGTLFLDEIGDLEYPNQAKLLRVLQDRTFHRLGESSARRSSFRLVAATHRDLPAMVAAGRFREDLYYRCNVFLIRVPSLRERLEDLPYIAEDLLRTAIEQLGLAEPPEIAPRAMKMLLAHPWPGNVRELENVLLRAAIAARGGEIRAEHISLDAGAPAPLDARAPLRPKTLGQVEREHVEAVLRDLHGNVRAAAAALGISRATLYRMLAKHGVPRQPGPTPRSG